MAPNILEPETEELVVREVDFTRLRFVISFREQLFTIVGSPERIEVYFGTEQEPAEFVQSGGIHSGAIWFRGDCVADYLVDQNRAYVVTQIEKAFRDTSSQMQSDPVLFLLSTAWYQTRIPAAEV